MYEILDLLLHVTPSYAQPWRRKSERRRYNNARRSISKLCNAPLLVSHLHPLNSFQLRPTPQRFLSIDERHAAEIETFRFVGFSIRTRTRLGTEVSEIKFSSIPFHRLPARSTSNL